MSDTKRVSAVIDMDLIRKMSEHNMSQTEAIVRGLEILFSDDYNNIISYKDQISTYKHENDILQAKLTEFDNLKIELERVHKLLEDQKEIDKAHMAQVQTLINEVRSTYDNIRQSNEGNKFPEPERNSPDRILLLEDNKNKKWWQRFKFLQN